MEISDAEVKKLTDLSDREGQLSRASFESYCRDSALMKSLDKNNDGIISELEMTSKHEMAFKVIVRLLEETFKAKCQQNCYYSFLPH